MKKIIVLFLCAAMLWPSPISLAGPQGGKVVGGNAQINQQGSSTTINQKTDRAIINWNSFDINKNESVRHNMPSSNSAGLHRVVGGGGASQIAGSLQSNGNIYLVNPAGVVIHNGAKIDVNGFVATSRDISDQNFMKGNMVFDRPGHPDAKIINKGNITLKDNGLAVLVAPTVRNDGVIAGKLGKVALGGSDAAWKLDMTGDDLIAFTLDEKAVDTLHSADGAPLASLENNGKIKADGGVVVMSAAQLDGFVGSVVNNGEISAASVENKGGKIIFRGQGDRVDLVNNDKLDVSSQSGDGGMIRMSGQARVVNTGRINSVGAKGGNVVLMGKDITLKTGSVIDASGMNGGGTVLVGGNRQGKGPEPNAKSVTVQSDAEILASAKLKGDGGEVVVWADEKTQFDRKIVAKGGEQGGDGGFVETSAKLLIIGDPAVVNTSAKMGKTGTWLMDPEDYVIANEGGNISAKTLMENLAIGNVSILSESFGLGNINVADAITWSADTALHLVARNNINVLAPITATGNDAGLYLEPKSGKLNLSAPITLSGTNPALYIKNQKYTVINNVNQLQAINDNLAANYALGMNIDASATKSWNDGAGFKPIGYEENKGGGEFTGVFNGLGHIIYGLTINRPETDFVGLFGHARLASISNLGLENVSITGGSRVGSIMGQSFCSEIYNSFSTGEVKGELYVGGFIGRLYGGGLLDPTGTPYITNCYTACNLTPLSDKSDYFGGFISLIDGWKGYVKNSYSLGHVPKTEHSGGFSAKTYTVAGNEIQNSYFDIDSSGMDNSAGGWGWRTEQFADQNNYGNAWDFIDTWEMNDSGFPHLKMFPYSAEKPEIPEIPEITEEPIEPVTPVPDMPEKPSGLGESKPAPTDKPIKPVAIPEQNLIIYNTYFGEPLIIENNKPSQEYRQSIEQNRFSENLSDITDKIKQREDEYFKSDQYKVLPQSEQLYLQAIRNYQNNNDIIKENIKLIEECNKVLLFRTCATTLVETGAETLINNLLDGSINIADLLLKMGKSVANKEIAGIILKSYLTSTCFEFSQKYLNRVEKIIYDPYMSTEEKTRRIAECIKDGIFFFVAGMKLLEEERENMFETADKGFLQNFFEAESRLIKKTLTKVLNPFKKELLEEADLYFATELPELYQVVEDLKFIKGGIDSFTEDVKKITAPFEKINDKAAEMQDFIADINADQHVINANNFIALIDNFQNRN